MTTATHTDFVPEVDESAPLEPWQECWRGGLAAQLPTRGLIALRDALIADSADLGQTWTVTPRPWNGAEEPPVCACPIAYCLWKGNNLRTVGEVAKAFKLAYFWSTADGYEKGSGAFTDFVDWVPRNQMRRSLLVEVNRTLKQREAEGGVVETCLAAGVRAGPVNEGVGSAA